MCACVYRRAWSRHQLLGANSSLDNTAVATHQCCHGCTIKTHTIKTHRQPCTCKRTLKSSLEVSASFLPLSPSLSVYFHFIEEPNTHTLLFTQAIFTHSLPRILHVFLFVSCQCVLTHWLIEWSAPGSCCVEGTPP